MREARVRGIWLAALVAVALLPLVAAAAADPLGRPRWWLADVSVAFGFMAFGVLALQFALVSRFGPASRPFGSDALMQLHRGLGLTALAFVVVHPLLLSGTSLDWRAWNPVAGPHALQTGAMATWATAVIVLTSIARKRLHLQYEWWQALHLVAACVVMVAAVAHLRAIGGYTAAPLVHTVAVAYGTAVALLLLRYRVIRPLWLGRRAWVVVANDEIGGSTRLLRLKPAAKGLGAFMPGQFAWLLTGRTPLLSQQHPLSIASSAAVGPDGTVEFAIKALGDWSSTIVPGLACGRRVWVDGPFGAFTPDGHEAAGLVLIAGGIGIAPMRSVLRTLSDRGDRRPVWLFYAASDRTRIVFEEEIAELQRSLALQAVYVFERPEAEWTGERGFITPDLLRRHLPAGFVAFRYFVCGPLPMMSALERHLTAIGVPASRVHTERFQMV